MTKLSIRWRLTLWYGATLAIVLGGFCLLIVVLARHQSLAHIDSSLKEELEERVLEVQLAHSMPELDTQLRTRFFQREVYEFRVLDSSGATVFVSSGLTESADQLPQRVSAPAQSPHFETAAIGVTGVYRIASADTKGTLGAFTVQVITPLEPYFAEFRSLQTIMLVLLPLAVAVASVGGYLLAGRALGPVKHIVDVADSITIDRLDHRIEIVNPNDEIGRLAATLNSLIARLERAVNEIQRFTADASHELRTPLAALRSEAEAALRSRRTPEEYENTLTVVVDEAARLSRLVDQLLNLSRQDAGILTCGNECVRLDALLLDVADQQRPFADERKVTIECSDIQPCEAQGDDIRLSQAFCNILENAVKYTPAEGKIQVRCRVSGGTATIEVTDSGIGIPAEHLPHVFDRFYRVDASRNCIVGGTGLGLSIARAAVLAHGGHIDVHSRPGAGTTVTIHLPAANEASDEIDSKPSLSATFVPCRNGEGSV